MAVIVWCIIRFISSYSISASHL